MLVGKPARSCKDFINQKIDNITLYQAYYLTKDYERKYLDNKFGQHRDYIMQPIEYFKLQAKNFFKDYKTKTPVFDKALGDYLYDYSPTYFDIDRILLEYDVDEENLSLMRAQHIIAQLAGFKKWTDLLHASEAEIELAKLLFDNQHKLSLDDWYDYIAIAEIQNGTIFDSEARLEIFKLVFLDVEGHRSSTPPYRFSNEKLW